MSKTKQEANPKSAKRLKQLYTEYQITQSSLSEKTGISQNTLSRIANGKVALSYFVACEIAKIFPDVSPEWLMGHSDFKNEAQKTLYPAAKSLHLKFKKEKAVLNFLKSFGVVIEINTDIGDMSTEQFFDLPQDEQENLIKESIEKLEGKEAFVIKSSDREIIKYISGEQKTRFIDDIFDYVEFKFEKLTEEKT